VTSLEKQLAVAVLEGDDAAAYALVDALIERRTIEMPSLSRQEMEQIHKHTLRRSRDSNYAGSFDATNQFGETVEILVYQEKVDVTDWISGGTTQQLLGRFWFTLENGIPVMHIDDLTYQPMTWTSGNMPIYRTDSTPDVLRIK